MKKIADGFLFVLEGIDGSGKSTLLKRLVSYLQAEGYDVLATKEPGGTPLGKEIRHLVQESKVNQAPEAEFLLFAADRADHIQKVVQPSLEKGMFVISDRMADSSLAYQGYGRGLDKEMIQSINNWVMGGIVPDLILYIKIDLKTAWQRIHARGQVLTNIEQEKKDFFERVMHGFDTIFADKKNGVIIDGTLGQDALFEEVLKVILDKLQKIS